MIYLQKSIIIVNNKYLRYLLEFLFTIQDPVSQVFIVDKIEPAPNSQNLAGSR